MTCRTVNFGNGVTAIVCDRGRKPALCAVCRASPHTKLCDFLLTGEKAGATCSARLCDRCAVVVGLFDFCPAHAKRYEQKRKETELGAVVQLIYDWCADRFVDVAEVMEFWAERAAIREHEANTPRWAAEELAFRQDVVERFGP